MASHGSGLLAAAAFCSLAFSASAQDIKTTVVAGGCFWCVESDFESLKGVVSAQSGFMGGDAKSADYKTVSKGQSDHLEAVQITYDADIISYRKILDIFWRSVDPTDAGGQFCDRGQAYTTAVFTNGPEESKIANASKKAAQSALGQKIVTPIRVAKTFYPADASHQDYYKSNDRVLTRFGLIKKKDAYKKYRRACGRDARTQQLWGSNAFPQAGS